MKKNPSKYASADEHTQKIFNMLGGKDFDRMRDYFYNMKLSLINQKALFQDSHKEELKIFPNATTLTNFVYGQRYENYDNHFLWILYNSGLVSSYSLFEIVFKNVCFYLAEVNGKVIKKDHFRRSKITENCKTFIETEIGLNIKPINKYWKQLVLAQQLRNKIVHQSASIPPGNTALRKYVRTNKSFYLANPRTTKDLDFVIKDPAFLFEYLTNSKSYLLWILMRAC